MRARYYNPLIRRFVNADPAQQGWNWYAYAAGNPLGFVDPTGLGNASVINAVQTGLTFLGMTPVVGFVADIANAGISVARGNYADASINLAAAVPGAGQAVAGAKLAGVGIGLAKIGRGADRVADVGRGGRSLPAPRQINVNMGAINDYRHGGRMSAIEHINYRHASNSGFSNVSRFSKDTSVKNIQSYIDNAVRYGDVTRQGANSFKIEYNLGRSIGTNQAGNPASGIRVFVRDGNLQTAFPY